MLAMDLEEAMATAEESLRGRSLVEFYDTVIVPALSLAEEERHRGKLDGARQHFIFQNTRLLVEDLGDRAEDPGHSFKAGCGGENDESGPNVLAGGETAVVCFPARDEADEIASLMLAQLLGQRGVCARSLTVQGLAAGGLDDAGQGSVRVACILAVPPFGYMHVRYLCRRLRTQFRGLKLVAAILTERDIEEIRRRQPPLPADGLASSLNQALAEVAAMLPGDRERPDQDPAARESGKA
jgi:hypothetical protein